MPRSRGFRPLVSSPLSAMTSFFSIPQRKKAKRVPAMQATIQYKEITVFIIDYEIMIIIPNLLSPTCKTFSFPVDALFLLFCFSQFKRLTEVCSNGAGVRL